MKPRFSQTLMFAHLYAPPVPIPSSEVEAANTRNPADIEAEKRYFRNFYDDIATELSKYGDIDVINVVTNLGAHMYGNVYVKYTDEVYAERAMRAVQGRYYAGRPIVVEYSPVTDFREARCGMFEDGECNRGDYCNFIHVHKIPRDMKYLLIDLADERHAAKRQQREREQSPERAPHDAGSDAGVAHENDEQRRARIKQWNAEKARQKQQAAT